MNTHANLPLSELRRIEEICARYESDPAGPDRILEWTRGERGKTREALLYELVRLDLELNDSADPQRYACFADPVDLAVHARAMADASAASTRSDASAEPSTGHGSQAGKQTSAVPDQIGPYMIERRLGRGGMGTVFVARQLHPIRRTVALKVLSDSYVSDELRQRFLSERQAQAILNHPNIAKVFEAGVTETDQPYLAMELIEGQPIDAFCRDTRADLSARLRLLVQICRAVQHAHLKGIVHRDLKPANVLVTPNDEDGGAIAKVIDFGLAKLVDGGPIDASRSFETRHGQLFGTLAYMSPEQASAGSEEVDARTDVYSLGVMLFRLVTGTTPLKSEEIESLPLDQVLAKIRYQPTPRPSVRVAERAESSESEWTALDVPAATLRQDLDWIICRATELEPERRYETPSALGDDLERFLEGKPILARPRSTTYVVGKWARRHRARFAAISLIAASIIIGFITSSTMWWRASKAETKAVNSSRIATERAIAATEAEIETRRQRDAAQRAADQARFVLSTTRWDAGRTADAVDALHQIDEANRGFGWKLAAALYRGTDEGYDGHRTGIRAIAVSPYGHLVATLDRARNIHVWNPETGLSASILENTDACNVAWGLQRNELWVLTVRGTIELWDVRHRVRTKIYESRGNSAPAVHGPVVGVAGFWLSLNRRIAAICNAEGQVDLLQWKQDSQELKSLGALSTSGKTGSRPFTPAISPDGATILTETDRSQIGLLNVATGEQVWSWERLYEFHAAFSPRGDQVFAVGRTWAAGIGLLAFDAQSGKTLWRVDSKLEYFPTSIAVSPDGTQLAIGRSDGGIDLHAASTGKFLHRYRGHRSAITDLAFNAFGDRIISGSDDESVRMWRCAAPDPGLMLDVGRAPFRVAISPSSEEVLVSLIGDWKRFSLDSAKWISMGRPFSPRDRSYNVHAAVWNRDGTRIFAANQNAISVYDAVSNKKLKEIRRPGIVEDDAAKANTETIKMVSTTLLATTDSDEFLFVFGDGSAELWDLHNDTPQRVIKQPITDAVFVGESNHLAYVNARGITLGEHFAETIRWTAIHAAASVVKVSPDATRLLSLSDRMVCVWDVQTGKKLASIPFPQLPFQDACFTPTTNQILTVDINQLRLWDLETGRELLSCRFEREPYRITSVDVSPDGNSVIVGAQFETCLFVIPLKQDKNSPGWTRYRSRMASFDARWSYKRETEAKRLGDAFAEASHYIASLLDAKRERLSTQSSSWIHPGELARLRRDYRRLPEDQRVGIQLQLQGLEISLN